MGKAARWGGWAMEEEKESGRSRGDEEREGAEERKESTESGRDTSLGSHTVPGSACGFYSARIYVWKPLSVINFVFALGP